MSHPVASVALLLGLCALACGGTSTAPPPPAAAPPVVTTAAGVESPPAPAAPDGAALGATSTVAAAGASPIYASAAASAAPSGQPLGCGQYGHSNDNGTSSTVLREGKVVHGPSNLGDDFTEDDESTAESESRDMTLLTAWCEGAEGDGVGEWVQMETCCVDDGALTVGVAPGYFAKRPTWEKNNRVAEAEVNVTSGTQSWTGRVAFEDAMSRQFFDVPGVQCGAEIVTVRLRILSVHPGTAYHDTCISDVAVYTR